MPVIGNEKDRSEVGALGVRSQGRFRGNKTTTLSNKN